jgi:hypothetical protein
MTSSMLPNYKQSCPMESVTGTDIVASLKIGNPNCKCAEKITDGTCKSYSMVMQLKHSISIYESKT